MTFRTVDELLTRQMAGDSRPPAAEHLKLQLVRFARGVAVYDMPLREEISDPSGAVASGVVATLAEAAMTAAATTAVADGQEWSPVAQGLSARFHRAVHVEECETLRAEAVVMGTDTRSVRVEAEVHWAGRRVGTFEATYARGPGTLCPCPGTLTLPAAERPLAEA